MARAASVSASSFASTRSGCLEAKQLVLTQSDSGHRDTESARALLETASRNSGGHDVDPRPQDLAQLFGGASHAKQLATSAGQQVHQQVDVAVGQFPLPAQLLTRCGQLVSNRQVAVRPACPMR